jgi:hypothetical protein
MIIKFHYNNSRNTISNISVVDNETINALYPYNAFMIGNSMVKCEVDPDGYFKYKKCDISYIRIFMDKYYKDIIRKYKLKRIIEDKIDFIEDKIVF